MSLVLISFLAILIKKESFEIVWTKYKMLDVRAALADLEKSAW